MDNRLNFISAWLRRDEPMGALCQRYRISRKTGYKWLQRYRQAGVVGLADLSSARHTQAHAMDEATADAILAFRRLHRTWGPRKLLVELEKLHPEADWPAASTIGDLLQRKGKVTRRKRQPAEPGRLPALTDPVAPNAIWSADPRAKPEGMLQRLVPHR
jgi:transposase